MSHEQREFALHIIKRLRAKGYEALLAGGCVRDQLLQREPKDYDVATNARPDEIQKLFGARKTLAMGAAFGVIGVLGGRGREPVEVATFRSDGNYVDGRRPESVVFTTAEQDAQRRDFTINGLFYDPLENRVLDYVGGQRDLELGLIRAIGDPRARFAEDKLRMMRAVRFAATFGFDIETTTLAAIQEMADDVTVVSAERIGAEMQRMLTHPRRAFACRMLHKCGLLQQILPEWHGAARDNLPSWEQTLSALEQLHTDKLAAALAVLVLELGDRRALTKLGKRFRFTNKDIDTGKWLLDQLPVIFNADTLPWPRVQRTLIHECAGDLLALASAVGGANQAGLQQCQHYMQLPAEQFNPPPLLSGVDLIQQGQRPGKHFAHLLDAVRDAQLEGRIVGKQQALELADRLAEQLPPAK